MSSSCSKLWMWGNRRHFTAGEPGLVIAPAHAFATCWDGRHRDAIVHRANQRAQVAADAFVFFNFGNRFAGHATGAETLAVRRNERNGLMRAVFASDVTQVATDALIVINLRDALVIEVELF